MKKPISATIEEDLIRWISQETERSNIYRNKSHLIEAALELLKQKIESENSAIVPNAQKIVRVGGRDQQSDSAARSRGKR